jgi:hypothetical protein
LLHVRLSFDRTLISRMHAALERAAMLGPGRALFPSLPSSDLQAQRLPDKVYADKVAKAAGSLVELGGTPLNKEQRAAIAAVLCRRRRCRRLAARSSLLWRTVRARGQPKRSCVPP